MHYSVLAMKVTDTMPEKNLYVRQRHPERGWVLGRFISQQKVGIKLDRIDDEKTKVRVTTAPWWCA